MSTHYERTIESARIAAGHLRESKTAIASLLAYHQEVAMAGGVDELPAANEQESAGNG